MKKKVIIIIVSILCILVGGFMAYNYLLLPKIELNGSKRVVIDYKEEYVEKGYKASYFDEDLTNDVKVKGKVDSEKLGTYEITYEVGKGNFKKRVVREVIVSDKTAPVINISDSKEVILCPGSKFKQEEFTASDNYDGDLTKKVAVKYTEEVVTYSVVDKSKNSFSINRTLKRVDNEAPSIKLKGSSTYNLTVGNSFSDPGYTVSDNCDGDVKVTVSGKVDTSKKGTYEIVYKAVDDNDNTVTVKRYVKVSEKSNHTGVIYLTFDAGYENGNIEKIDADITMYENDEKYITMEVFFSIKEKKNTYIVPYTFKLRGINDYRTLKEIEGILNS